MESKEKNTRLTKSKLYKRLFSSEDGNRVLQDLMVSHYMMGNTMSADPYVTAFNEGQRNVVLRLLKLVKEDVGAIEKRISDVEKEYYNER